MWKERINSYGKIVFAKTVDWDVYRRGSMSLLKKLGLSNSLKKQIKKNTKNQENHQDHNVLNNLNLSENLLRELTDYLISEKSFN